MTNVYKKPPLGIMPRNIWEEQRVDDILEAMKRYSLEEVPIPNEWVEELKELTNRLVR